jgi:hypothetical protein
MVDSGGMVAWAFSVAGALTLRLFEFFAARTGNRAVLYLQTRSAAVVTLCAEGDDAKTR